MMFTLLAMKIYLQVGPLYNKLLHLQLVIQAKGIVTSLHLSENENLMIWELTLHSVGQAFSEEDGLLR